MLISCFFLNGLVHYILQLYYVVQTWLWFPCVTSWVFGKTCAQELNNQAVAGYQVKSAMVSCLVIYIILKTQYL